MKKKLFVALIPALMILCSCQAHPKVEAKDVILEDTVAHEEVFGGQDSGKMLRAVEKRAPSTPLTAPKIGYQIHYDSESGKIAIRFVAALKELNVKAEWKRGITKSNGTIINGKGFENAAKESTYCYSVLSNGSNTLTAGSGDFSGYSAFVVYSMYNIDYATYSNSYIAAYLTISDLDDLSNKQQTSALAVKVERSDDYTSANVFTFNPGVAGHFLQGKINNTPNTLLREDVSVAGDNYASYTDVELTTNDSFGSFYYRPYINEGEKDIFLYYGHSEFFDTSSSFFDESSLAGYNTPKSDGTYDFYVSSDNENHVYTVDTSAEFTYTIWGMPDWITNESAKIFVWAWGYKNPGRWIEITDIITKNQENKYWCYLTISGGYKLDGFQVVRCHSGTVTPNWDQAGDVAGRIFNNTGDVDCTDEGLSKEASGWVEHNP